MNPGQSRLSLVFIVAALLLAGFVAGYWARVPIERGAVRLKASIAGRAHQKYLDAKFLGKPAADIDSPRLDGSPFSLTEKKGKVLLLFFWASWCPYSRSALSGIQAIYERYADRDDFEIIGLSLDRSRDSLSDFITSRGIRWVNLYEDGKAWNSGAAKSYEVRAIPSRWVVDRSQSIAGAELSHAATEDLLSLLLENRHRTSVDSRDADVSATAEGGGCAASEAQ